MKSICRLFLLLRAPSPSHCLWWRPQLLARYGHDAGSAVASAHFSSASGKAETHFHHHCGIFLCGVVNGQWANVGSIMISSSHGRQRRRYSSRRSNSSSSSRSTTTDDWYEVLGVKPTATQDEIKRAYHIQALKWHPDRNKADMAVKEFKRVGEAYSILSDQAKRNTYDENMKKLRTAAQQQSHDNDWGPFTNQQTAYRPQQQRTSTTRNPFTNTTASAWQQQQSTRNEEVINRTVEIIVSNGLRFQRITEIVRMGNGVLISRRIERQNYGSAADEESLFASSFSSSSSSANNRQQKDNSFGFNSNRQQQQQQQQERPRRRPWTFESESGSQSTWRQASDGSYQSPPQQQQQPTSDAEFSRSYDSYSQQLKNLTLKSASAMWGSLQNDSSSSSTSSSSSSKREVPNKILFSYVKAVAVSWFKDQIQLGTKKLKEYMNRAARK
jgi:curved DNA-binding protein CbpA